MTADASSLSLPAMSHPIDLILFSVGKSWWIVDYRGNGLQKTLLLEQLRLTEAKYFEGTINPSNGASEKNFLEIARILNTDVSKSVLFSEEDFGNDGHEAEHLYRIGPISLVGLKNSADYSI